jgi:hypothetical protein
MHIAAKLLYTQSLRREWISFSIKQIFLVTACSCLTTMITYLLVLQFHKLGH